VGMVCGADGSGQSVARTFKRVNPRNPQPTHLAGPLLPVVIDCLQFAFSDMNIARCEKARGWIRWKWGGWNLAWKRGNPI